MQSGGLLTVSRTSAANSTNGLYLTQAGTTNYTLTGGSVMVGGNGVNDVLVMGDVGGATLNINGVGALVRTSSLNLNGGAAGPTGAVNLQNGLLQTNMIFQSAGGFAFNFSGGTLQPIDGNVVGFGSSAAASNVALTISGSAAVISSTDSAGNPQTVPVYANFAGSGLVNLGGAGTLVLRGTSSTFTGAYSVNSGTVQPGSANALFGQTVTVAGGTFDINGLTPSVGTIALAAGSIANGGVGGALNASAYVLQSGTASAVLGGANVPLVKTTSGLAVLNAANTYSGPTTVSAGTLAIGPLGSLGPTNVTITPGGVLDVSAFGPSGYTFSNMTITAGRTSSFGTDINGNVNMSNATVAPAAQATMTIAGNLSMNGSVNYSFVPGDQIAVNGALALNAPTYVLPGVALSAGTYTLMTYTSGSPNLSNIGMGGSFQSGTRQSYTFGTSGGSAVTLAVGGNPGFLQWNTANGTWNLNSAASWFNTTTSSADVFYNGDSVTFNDRPGGSSATVSISGAVAPSTLTVSNTAVAYTFGGGGSITGISSLVKNGPGALTINNSNTYSGGTFMGGGLLSLNNASALGSGTLTISGGSLDNTSGTAVTLAASLPQVWNSGINFLGSNSLNLGNGPVTLNVAPTITVNASTLTVGGNISGPYGLTLAGHGTLVLGGSNTYTGGATINGGTLQLASAAAMPSGTNASNLVFSNAANSAALDLGGNNAAFNSLSQPAATATNMVVNSSGTATLTVGNGNATSTYGGLLANGAGGVLALTKIGTGSLTLLNGDTFTGLTTISAGTLQLGIGVAGQDGGLASSSILNNATFVNNNVGPTSFALPISGTGKLVQSSPSTLTLTGSNVQGGLVLDNSGTITGGTINLVSGSTITNNAPGLTTLASPVNILPGTGTNSFVNNSGGTLVLAAPVTDIGGGNLF